MDVLGRIECSSDMPGFAIESRCSAESCCLVIIIKDSSAKLKQGTVISRIDPRTRISEVLVQNLVQSSQFANKIVGGHKLYAY